MRIDSDDRLPRRWLLACLGIAAAVQLVVVNYWPAFPSPNERSRAYQAIAIVSRGSLSIDAEIARFGGMEDLAESGGRLYPNKAPGTLPLLIPAALAARAVAAGSPERELAVTLALGRLLVSALPFLLTVLLLARFVTAPAGRGAALAVIAFALAGPALTCSLLLFSHSLAALLLFAAFLLLYATPAPSPWHAAAAGLAIGWSVNTEFSAVLPAAVMVAVALGRLRVPAALAIGLGGAGPLLALLAYNQACFGSPFELSYGHETHAAFAAINQQGIFGVRLPTISGAVGLVLSPARGILVWAPVIVLGGAGLRRSAPGDGARLAALAIAPLALLIGISGFPNWHGGWFPGPRYLLPVWPLAFVLVARGAERACRSGSGRVAAAALALWGLALTWLSLSAFPFPPEDYPLPALTFSLPLLRAGVVVPSWLPRGAAAATLAGLAAAAVYLVCRTACRTRREAAAALALTAAVLGLAATTGAPATWKARLEMAVVHDVYAAAPRPGALEALEPLCETRDQRLRLAEWIAERDRARPLP